MNEKTNNDLENSNFKVQQENDEKFDQEKEQENKSLVEEGSEYTETASEKESSENTETVVEEESSDNTETVKERIVQKPLILLRRNCLRTKTNYLGQWQTVKILENK